VTKSGTKSGTKNTLQVKILVVLLYSITTCHILATDSATGFWPKNTPQIEVKILEVLASVDIVAMGRAVTELVDF